MVKNYNEKVFESVLVDCIDDENEPQSTEKAESA